MCLVCPTKLCDLCRCVLSNRKLIYSPLINIGFHLQCTYSKNTAILLLSGIHSVPLQMLFEFEYAFPPLLVRTTLISFLYTYTYNYHLAFSSACKFSGKAHNSVLTVGDP